MTAPPVTYTPSLHDALPIPRHAYTRALLSAMPVPDPLFEQRKEILPCPGDESDGTWREVHPGHWLRG